MLNFVFHPMLTLAVFQWAINASLAVSTGSDFAVAAAMVYYLLKSRSNFAKYVLSTMVLRAFSTMYFSTNSQLASLIQYSLASGVATRSI
jgi:hypothetical protein